MNTNTIYKNTHIIEYDISNIAHITGFLYLLIIIFGISSELFVRANIYLPNDPLVTAQNILSNRNLFLSGFLLDILMLMLDTAVAVLLFIIFKQTNSTLALLAMLFRFLQTTILSSNLTNYFTPALILKSNDSMTEENIQLSHLLLEVHSYGYDFGLIFFAISNLLLGIIILQSIKIPNIIGIGLILAALSYLVGSILRFTSPSLYIEAQVIYLIPFIAELSFSLWLIFVRPETIDINNEENIL